MARLSLEETMNQLKARLEEVEFKNAVLSEALEFYSDQDNYYMRPIGHGFLPSIVTEDNGDIAYKALNGVDHD